MVSKFVRVGASLKEREFELFDRICRKLGKRPGEVCLDLLREFIEEQSNGKFADVFQESFEHLRKNL